jgi:hypothetical protein
VREVEAQLAGLFDGLGQVVGLEVVVEDHVVANLGNLGDPLGT